MKQTKKSIPTNILTETVCYKQQKRKNEVDRDKLLHHSLTQKEVEELMKLLKDKSTAPLSNSRSASKMQSDKIESIFKEDGVRVGVYRMETILNRKYGKKSGPKEAYEKLTNLEKSLAKLSIGQLRGIYKRRKLKRKKRRSASGKERPLYDYWAIACLSNFHYDTKHILDLDALPPKIYEKFKNNKNLPLYEWNIIDARSRFRFIAYSRNLNSEFGLKFLLLVIQYIRAYTNNWDLHIKVGGDNGPEFCCGSERKEKQWNKYLSRLNASYYSYDGKRDVRKNLIERSHATDDSEFYIPRGDFINTKKDFLKEAAGYQFYFNAQRNHSGKGMEGRTPFEVLEDKGVFGAKRLLEFPTMILEDTIDTIREHTDYLLFDSELTEYDKIDRLVFDKVGNKYEFFNDELAQNVLTYHRR